MCRLVIALHWILGPFNNRLFRIAFLALGWRTALLADPRTFRRGPLFFSKIFFQIVIPVLRHYELRRNDASLAYLWAFFLRFKS